MLRHSQVWASCIVFYHSPLEMAKQHCVTCYSYLCDPWCLLCLTGVQAKRPLTEIQPHHSLQAYTSTGAHLCT